MVVPTKLAKSTRCGELPARAESTVCAAIRLPSSVPSGGAGGAAARNISRPTATKLQESVTGPTQWGQLTRLGPDSGGLGGQNAVPFGSANHRRHGCRTKI